MQSCILNRPANIQAFQLAMIGLGVLPQGVSLKDPCIQPGRAGQWICLSKTGRHALDKLKKQGHAQQAARGRQQALTTWARRVMRRLESDLGTCPLGSA